MRLSSYRRLLNFRRDPVNFTRDSANTIDPLALSWVFVSSTTVEMYHTSTVAPVVVIPVEKRCVKNGASSAALTLNVLIRHVLQSLQYRSYHLRRLVRAAMPETVAARESRGNAEMKGVCCT